jgi:hypothetical protein
VQEMESFIKYSLELKNMAKPSYISRDANALHDRAEELSGTCDLSCGFHGTAVSFTPLNIHDTQLNIHDSDKSENSKNKFVGKIDVSTYRGERMLY